MIVLPDITAMVAIGNHKFNVTHWIRLIVGTCTPVDNTPAIGCRRRTAHAEKGSQGSLSDRRRRISESYALPPPIVSDAGPETLDRRVM